MDLARFVSLVETHALHFTRLDRLGDPFEGSVTAALLATKAEDDTHSEANWSFITARLRHFLFASSSRRCCRFRSGENRR